jgi:hypothetical protein
MMTCEPAPERPTFKVLKSARRLTLADQWLLHGDVEGILMDGDAGSFVEAERVLLQRIGGTRNLDGYMDCLRAGACRPHHHDLGRCSH